MEIGDYVIVHVGFAISKVDEAEAQRTFEALREMSQLEELEWMKDADPAGRAPGGGAAMRYLTEYRDAHIARALAKEIRQTATRSWMMMEVCGGQTHTIVKQGLDELPEGAVEMVHGPGCPVCVTPLEQIDRALKLAATPGVISHVSFGDMLRVPGSECDLFQVRARGGNVRIVYSPLDALELAIKNPDRADRLLRRRLRDDGAGERDGGVAGRAELGVKNFSVLVSHVTRAAGDAGHPRRARQSGAGLSGRRARLHGDGIHGVRADRGDVPRADRRDRLRTGGPAGRDV